jgi:hypothetical protein
MPYESFLELVEKMKPLPQFHTKNTTRWTSLNNAAEKLTIVDDLPALRQFVHALMAHRYFWLQIYARSTRLALNIDTLGTESTKPLIYPTNVSKYLPTRLES